MRKATYLHTIFTDQDRDGSTLPLVSSDSLLERLDRGNNDGFQSLLIDGHLDGEVWEAGLARSDGGSSRIVGRVLLAMRDGTKGLEKVTNDTDTEELQGRQAKGGGEIA